MSSEILKCEIIDSQLVTIHNDVITFRKHYCFNVIITSNIKIFLFESIDYKHY